MQNNGFRISFFQTLFLWRYFHNRGGICAFSHNYEQCSRKSNPLFHCLGSVPIWGEYIAHIPTAATQKIALKCSTHFLLSIWGWKMCGTAMNWMRIFIYKKATVTQQKLRWLMVDLRRFELPTPTMRMWCAPSCATSPFHLPGYYTLFRCQSQEFGAAAIMKFCHAGGNWHFHPFPIW